MTTATAHRVLPIDRAIRCDEVPLAGDPLERPGERFDHADLEALRELIPHLERDMLAFALKLPLPLAGEGRGEGARVLPLIAYGHPVRAWVESEFGVALGVLSLGSITLDDGQTVPVLGANHPSFIWYAAQQPNARPLALKVMKQDLIAACWQAAMTRATAPDPAAAPAWCTAKWNARPRDVCVLTETQAFNTPAAQARKACSAAAMKALLAAPVVSDDEVARIEATVPLGRIAR